MYCKNCGKELVGAKVFCQNCGARQDAADSANQFQDGQTFAKPYAPANAMPFYGDAKVNATSGLASSAICFLAVVTLAWIITHFALLRFIVWPVGLLAQDGMKYTSYFMGASSLISAIVLLVLRKLSQGKIYILFSILTGVILAVILLFARFPLLRAGQVAPDVFFTVIQSTDIYILSLPIVTLSMSLGLLLLTRGGRTYYFIIRAVGVVLCLGLSVFMVLGAKFGVAGTIIATSISEIITAILFGVFAVKSNFYSKKAEPK